MGGFVGFHSCRTSELVLQGPYLSAQKLSTGYTYRRFSTPKPVELDEEWGGSFFGWISIGLAFIPSAIMNQLLMTGNFSIELLKLRQTWYSLRWQRIWVLFKENTILIILLLRSRIQIGTNHDKLRPHHLTFSHPQTAPQHTHQRPLPHQ